MVSFAASFAKQEEGKVSKELVMADKAREAKPQEDID